MRYFKFVVLLFLGASLFAASCSAPPSAPTLSESTKKLKTICKEEYGLDVVVYQQDNTLWIYVPTEEPFFNLKVSEDGPQEPQPPSESRQLFFLDSKFVNDSFRIRYDIGKAKKTADSPGFGFQYSQKFQDTQRNLLTAISRSLAEVERRKNKPGLFARIAGDVDYQGEEKNATHKQLVHSYVQTEQVPEFFVLVIADIKTGLESKMYFYLEDLLRGMTDPLFGEEYTRRVMNEGATGCLDIVGDRTGRHLKIYNLTWPEFLAKQIAHRMRFKYTQSDFKPTDNSESVFLTTVAQTLQAYEFDKFTTVELMNLSQENPPPTIFSKQQLRDYLSEK